jgi:hypothetical protein
MMVLVGYPSTLMALEALRARRRRRARVQTSRPPRRRPRAPSVLPGGPPGGLRDR